MNPARWLLCASCLIAVDALAKGEPGDPRMASADGCVPYWKLVEADCPRDTLPVVYCDPAHERLTRSVLRSARIGADVPNDPVVSEYLRGVLWNDDPEGLLIDDAGVPTRGATWCKAFVAARKQARAGHAPTSLLGRSHFGDLQVLHGMASRAGLTSKQVFDQIIPWVELFYRVGTGEIAGTTLVKDVPVKELAPRLKALRAKSMNELLGVRGKGDVRARAIGALMHFLQDAQGDGHAVRANLKQFAIDHYLTYSRGGHALHAGDSKWRDLWDPDASLTEWPGTLRSLQTCVDVLRLALRGEPWPLAQSLIERVDFEYTDFNARSVAWQPPTK